MAEDGKLDRNWNSLLNCSLIWLRNALSFTLVVLGSFRVNGVLKEREAQRGSDWQFNVSIIFCPCRTPNLKHLSSGRASHVLSLRMIVASIRKNVFQPRVTAKPRQTIIRDRPQPECKIRESVLSNRISNKI